MPASLFAEVNRYAMHLILTVDGIHMQPQRAYTGGRTLLNTQAREFTT